MILFKVVFFFSKINTLEHIKTYNKLAAGGSHFNPSYSGGRDEEDRGS
jgi:hypothetical protein